MIITSFFQDKQKSASILELYLFLNDSHV